MQHIRQTLSNIKEGRGKFPHSTHSAKTKESIHSTYYNQDKYCNIMCLDHKMCPKKMCLDHKIVLFSCCITQLFRKFVLISCVLISCRINYMSYTFHVLRYKISYCKVCSARVTHSELSICVRQLTNSSYYKNKWYGSLFVAYSKPPQNLQKIKQENQ